MKINGYLLSLKKMCINYGTKYCQIKCHNEIAITLANFKNLGKLVTNASSDTNATIYYHAFVSFDKAYAIIKIYIWTQCNS